MEQGGIWLQTQLRLLCTAHHLPTVQHVDKIGLLDHCDDDVIFKTPCHHNICRRPNPTHRKWSHHSGRQGEASWVSYFTARLHSSQFTVPGPTVEGSQPGSRAQSSARIPILSRPESSSHQSSPPWPLFDRKVPQCCAIFF